MPTVFEIPMAEGWEVWDQSRVHMRVANEDLTGSRVWGCYMISHTINGCTKCSDSGTRSRPSLHVISQMAAINCFRGACPRYNKPPFIVFAIFQRRRIMRQ